MLFIFCNLNSSEGMSQPPFNWGYESGLDPTGGDGDLTLVKEVVLVNREF